MKESSFASQGEIRQFLVAFLTTVIVVTAYHVGCAIIDYMHPDSQKAITIVNNFCPNHDDETGDD